MGGTRKRHSSTKQEFTHEVKNDSDADLTNPFTPTEVSDTTDESDVSEYGKGRKKRLVKKKKPKRMSTTTNVTRAPDLPTMSDIEYDGDRSSPELGACTEVRRHITPQKGVSRASRLAVDSHGEGTTSVRSGTPGIVQIHVTAAAAAGGMTINLDLSDIVLGKRTFAEIGPASLPTPGGSEGPASPTRIVINKTGQIQSTTPAPSNKRLRMLEDADARAGLGQQSKKGFCDIPFELRVRIYRQVFVTETPIDFASRSNFARSSAFLRTCQAVHHEGRAVLYGENAFHFERSQGTRGTFFESTWKEIGFKDARRFLETIGTANISRIRYMSFHFQDAAPSTTAHLDENERRFVNDPVLHHVLRLIGAHARLTKIAFQFSGRKQLQKFDYNFLQALSSIKSEEVIHAKRMTYATSKPGDEGIVEKLQKVMTVPRADQAEISVGKKKGPRVKMFHERPMPSSYHGGGW